MVIVKRWMVNLLFQPTFFKFLIGLDFLQMVCVVQTKVVVTASVQLGGRHGKVLRGGGITLPSRQISF